jgi:hypothetical protein
LPGIRLRLVYAGTDTDRRMVQLSLLPSAHLPTHVIARPGTSRLLRIPEISGRRAPLGVIDNGSHLVQDCPARHTSIA